MSETETTAIKPRSHQTALLLTLGLPGLGHLYCGDVVAAVVWAAISAASGLVSLWLLAARHLSVAFVPSVIVMIAAAVHVWATVSRTPKDYTLKPFNRIYVYLLFLGICSVGGLGHALVVREHYVEAFFIPTASMSPTIQPGDRILVDKTAYRTKQVRRGDVIVFQNPEKPSQMYIKRVVALAGETVAIQDGQLLIDDAPVDSNATDTTDDFAAVTVPPYNCFVIGDNVDNSRDSRHYGPIPLASVSGQVAMKYWPPFQRLASPSEQNTAIAMRSNAVMIGRWRQPVRSFSRFTHATSR